MAPRFYGHRRCWQVCSQAFNQLVPGIVAAHAAKGMDIHYVPMAETSGVCVDKGVSEPLSGLCCAGEVHPTANGCEPATVASPAQPGPMHTEHRCVFG